LLPPFKEGWGGFYGFICSSLLREVGRDLIFESFLKMFSDRSQKRRMLEENLFGSKF